MNALRVVEGHRRAGDVAVAARPDTAADDDGFAMRVAYSALSSCIKRDRVAIDLLHAAGVEAELGAPIESGAPSRAFQNEAGARRPCGELEESPEITAQMLAPFLRLQQDEGGELR